MYNIQILMLYHLVVKKKKSKFVSKTTKIFRKDIFKDITERYYRKRIIPNIIHSNLEFFGSDEISLKNSIRIHSR